MADENAATESGLRAQVFLLWRNARLIAAGAVLLAAAAAAWSLLRPVTYESAATVSVYAGRLADGFVRLPADGFLPLMESPAVFADAAAKLSMPMPALQSAVTLRVVPESNLVRVVARSGDANQAATMASTVAMVAVEKANQMTRSDLDVLDTELKSMVETAASRLQVAEQAYEEFRRSAQIEAVEREIDTLLEQRADLMSVDVELEAERARLARAEQDAARQQPITALRQSVIEDPAMHEAVRNSAPPGRDPLSIEMRREVPNEAWVRLDEEVAATRAQVAALERRRASLAQKAGPAGKNLARLDELYRRQSRLERLEVELKLAQKTYEDVSAKYQGARLAALARMPQLRVVDDAVVPQVPLGRYVTRNVLFGLAAGALLTCAVVVLRDALRTA